MSDEQRKDDEIDVESHLKKPHSNEEPAQDGDDQVEAHRLQRMSTRMDSPSNEVESHLKKPHSNEEPAQDGDDEVEAHRMQRMSMRMDSPSND
jgi:hypothetical protein